MSGAEPLWEAPKAEPPDPQAPGIGRNSPPKPAKPDFKAVLAENMRGLNRAQRDTLVRAIRDPLLSERHRIVLAEIIMRANSQTGVAYPGYRGIAEATGYSESTVELTVTQLLGWGYLASTRKAAEPGGRALAHYTVIKPTVEQLQAAITAHMMAQRGKADPNPTVRNTDPNPTVRNSGSVPNPPPRKTGSVPNPVVRQYLEEKKELEEREPADAGAPPPDLVDKGSPAPVTPPTKVKAPAAAVQTACDLYNEAAKAHGWTVCATLTPPRAKRLEGRLRDIGGLEAFKRALSAIPRDDFLMGRRATKAGERPFKLDIDNLLQTDGKWATCSPGCSISLARRDQQPDADAARAQQELEDAIARLRAEGGRRCRR